MQKTKKKQQEVVGTSNPKLYTSNLASTSHWQLKPAEPRPRAPDISIHRQNAAPMVKPPKAEPKPATTPSISFTQQKLLDTGMTAWLSTETKMIERQRIAEETLKEAEQELKHLESVQRKNLARQKECLIQLEGQKKEFMEHIQLAALHGHDIDSTTELHYQTKFRYLQDKLDQITLDIQIYEDRILSAQDLYHTAKTDPSLNRVNTLTSKYKKNMERLGQHDVISHLTELNKFRASMRQSGKLANNMLPLQAPKPSVRGVPDDRVSQMMQACKARALQKHSLAHSPPAVHPDDSPPPPSVVGGSVADLKNELSSRFSYRDDDDDDDIDPMLDHEMSLSVFEAKLA
jgi:hypothetical protein